MDMDTVIDILMDTVMDILMDTVMDILMDVDMDKAPLICVDTMDMDITDMDTVILKVTPTGLIEVD